MNEKRKHDEEEKGGTGGTRPIHSAGDVHDNEEGMPLTLAAGGYGGTPKTTDQDEAEKAKDK